jgi:hypothetical protein
LAGAAVLEPLRLSKLIYQINYAHHFTIKID